MSDSFYLALNFGAVSRLCFSSIPAKCIPRSLCLVIEQSVRSFFPTVSMRFKPKRTCSGVVYFRGYHINHFIIFSCSSENLSLKTFADLNPVKFGKIIWFLFNLFGLSCLQDY